MIKPPDKFHEISEIIFAIFMLEGFIQAGRSFSWTLLQFKNLFTLSTSQLFFSWFVCLLVLVRFFFAPYRDLRRLINCGPSLDEPEAKKYYPKALILDLPILLIHSILFYEMCSHVDNSRYFLLAFYLLLLINVLWLTWIRKRLQDRGACDAKLGDMWIKNNAVCVALASVPLVALFFTNGYWGITCKTILLLTALGNSLYDLIKTYPNYLGE